jgi:hypothetical protein
MASEKLTIELDARTAKLESSLKSTDEKLNKLSKSSSKTDSKMQKLSGAASGVGKGLGKLAGVAKTGALALAGLQAALLGVAKVAAEQGKEIKNAADLTGVSVEKMQALGAATDTVGVSMEQLSDMSKDANEKIGDFLNTGGGGFQDFADAMGLSADEAKEMANQFQGLTGPEVLQKMTSQMEAAGVSGDQMSHALEGMASDATKLIPLLKNNGAELDRLKEKFYQTNVVLSETDITKLGEMEQNFKSLGDTFNATMGKFSVLYADQINDMISDTQEGLKIVGDEFASGSFTDRLNSFYDAFTGSWSDAFGDNIEITDEFLGDVQETIKSIGRFWLEFTLTLPINMKLAGLKVAELFNDIVDEVKIALGEMNVTIQEGLDLIGQGNLSGAQEQLQAIQDQVEARDLQADAEIAALEKMKEARLAAFDQEQEQATIKRERYAEDSAARMLIDDKEAEEEQKRLKNTKKGNEKLGKDKANQNKKDEKDEKDKNKMMESNARSAMDLSAFVFEDNKAISAGIAVINTAEGITAALAKQNYAGAALTAAMGAAQISSILSASKGGGSVAPVQSSVTPTGPDFVQDTDALQLTDSSASGSASNEIRFATDSGDELIDALASALNKGQSEGRF